MFENKRKTGATGEELALHFLKKQGYKIIQTNFKNKIGEIDIIAKDKGCICFIEVKARKSGKYGSPFDAVTRWKQKQLIKVAQSYIQDNRLENEHVRFDVVGVYLDGHNRIEVIKNAIELS